MNTLELKAIQVRAQSVCNELTELYYKAHHAGAHDAAKSIALAQEELQFVKEFCESRTRLEAVASQSLTEVNPDLT